MNRYSRICLGIAGAMAIPCLLSAQTTTATLRGKVRALKTSGEAVSGATLSAVNSASGYTYKANSRADGSYNLTLEPSTYSITVTSASFSSATKTIRVQVGQALELNFELVPVAQGAAVVEVLGTAVEVKTSEVATNVTTEQIENLPQGNRNFLNFAALAPGIRLSTDEQRQTFSGGGQIADRVNIFIDGASYKNDVLQGGTAGQDASRGNPFPTGAVQEFRVLTENFKAEYQKASSAIITAVTKSGSNEFHGDLFAYYQNKSLVANDYFAEKNGTPKPTYERWQTGFSVGGPIIKDQMHFFVSFEQNRQNRDARVFVGGGSYPAGMASYFKGFEGTIGQPFRSNLFFGKVDYQIDASQFLEFTVNLRSENETRDFGDQTSVESANYLKNTVNTFNAKHKLASANWLNEAMLSFQTYEWQTIPLNGDLVGKNYFGVMRVGGRDTSQHFTQERTSLRDDFTYLALPGHQIKAGGNLDFLTYKVQKYFNGNPVFNYRYDIDPTFQMPFEALYGVGDPNMNAKNKQFGWYIQDDWNVTPQLLLNLGLRWDYESDMHNNSYVTPAKLRQDLSWLVPAHYMTDGNQRKADYTAFQPRLGFSYDLNGSSRTVVFGGIGRYYDRENYNNMLDEKFRLQFAVRNFAFSADGGIRDGRQTIKWSPSYLSKSGLDGLIAQGLAPNPEAFFLDNDLKAPYSDQISLGIRHSTAQVNYSLTLTNTHSQNSLTWKWGDRDANLNKIPTPGYANVLVSDTKETWYQAMFVKVDRPYTESSGWGAGLSYTLAKAEQTGNDLFSLDFTNAAAYGRHPTNDDERHRLVANGITKIPFGFRLSGLLTLGSGTPYTIFDVSNGWDYNKRHFQFGGGRPSGLINYKSLDLKLQKDFTIGKSRLGINAEAINVFNWVNYDWNQWDTGFIDTLPNVNSKFGTPVKSYIGRRLQFGLSYTF